ncbi:LOW QUALITY PROTEIN: conserved Plasmodium protein, unknown function [Plasmodium relictum]|uniref:C2H2-type domain-containing protein n=1 Tax=Plasmodium relictum TaxID=85471 RepID=A0A1J1H560_PLARL|nr:LOW QUALITY PROTEIN: conserved Plasmodium protein, unknown function [Plasmodium relictum]CRG98563.1 conserved Plasmodium protein, unknown function [Plasmodium relictum]
MMINNAPDILNCKSNNSIDKQDKISDCYELENEKIFVYRCNICLLVFTCVYSFANHISNENHRVKQLDALKKDKYFNCLRCKYICLSVVKIIKHIELYNHGQNILKKIKRKILYTGTVNCACKTKCYFFYSQNKNFRSLENIPSNDNNLLNVKSEIERRNSYEEQFIKNNAYNDKCEDEVSPNENVNVENYNNQNKFIQNLSFEKLKESIKEISTNDNIKMQLINYLQKNSICSFYHNYINNNMNNYNKDSNFQVGEQALNLHLQIDKIKDFNNILLNLDKYEEKKEIKNTSDIKKNLLLFIHENTYNLNKTKNCHSNINNDKKNDNTENEDELSVFDNNSYGMNTYSEENYIQFKNSECNQFKNGESNNLKNDEYNQFKNGQFSYFKNNEYNQFKNGQFSDFKNNEYNQFKNGEFNNLKNDEYNQFKNGEFNNLKNDEYNQFKSEEFNNLKNDEYNQFKSEEFNNLKNDEYNQFKSEEKDNYLWIEDELKKNKQEKNQECLNQLNNLNELHSCYISNDINYSKEITNKGNLNYELFFKNNDERFYNIYNEDFVNPPPRSDEKNKINISFNSKKNSNDSNILEAIYKMENHYASNHIINNTDKNINKNAQENINKNTQENINKNIYQNMNEDINKSINKNMNDKINENAYNNVNESINNYRNITKSVYDLEDEIDFIYNSNPNFNNDIVRKYFSENLKSNLFDSQINDHIIDDKNLNINSDNFFTQYNFSLKETEKKEDIILENSYKEIDVFDNFKNDENIHNIHEMDASLINKNMHSYFNDEQQSTNDINKNENNINNEYNIYNQKKNSNYLTSNLLKNNNEKKNYIIEYEEEMKTKLLNRYNDNITNEKKISNINILNKLENSNVLKNYIELFNNLNKSHDKMDITNYNFMHFNKYSNQNNDNTYINILTNLQKKIEKREENDTDNKIEKKEKKNLNFLKNKIFKAKNLDKVDSYISTDQNYDSIFNENDNFHINIHHINEKNNKNTLNEIVDINKKRKSFIEEIDELKKIIEEDKKNNSNTMNFTAINLNNDKKNLNSNPLCIEKNNLLNDGKIKKYNTTPNNRSSDYNIDFNIKSICKSNTDYFQKYALNSNKNYNDTSNEQFNNFISNLKKTNN